jgi:hypothetical protein
MVVVAGVFILGCPQKVSVPHLEGKARTAAENLIVASGLIVGTITEQYHDTVTSGCVISQYPAADTMVSPDSAVNMVISKGAQHASYEDSVKLLTFNVRMIPETWDDFCCDISNKNRAELIGDLIRAEDYDIVVLNEVFDEDSRTAFEDRLSGTFPYYVLKIDKPTDMEDSGLMLFSRFPFEPLPNPDWMFSFPLLASPFIQAYSDGADAWEKVAAIVYPSESCDDYDCDSAKGVGLVRVRNPQTGHIMNVAFSHTQASYGDGDCEAEVDGRSMQFALVQELLKVVLGNNRLNAEPVFLLGDLNLDGDQDFAHITTNPGYVHGGPCTSESRWEWNMRFGSPGTFFTDTLMDSFVYEQQGLDSYNNPVEFDWGLTAGLPVPTERLDYVLWSHDSRYQVQHVTREHGLRVADGYILSDHIPVCANYNAATPHCNPMDASVPAQDTLVPGNISKTGGMQWYRIDEPGTYLVAVTGNDMAYSIYESKDLTTPAPQYYEETGTIQVQQKPAIYVTAPKFCMPEAPFYIRVYKTARNLTGSYQLAVHRMTGESKEEAVSLLPGAEWLEYGWPGVPLNQEDCVWFKLRIDTADNPVPQKTQFRVARYFENNVTMTLLQEDGNTLAKDDEAAPYGPQPNTWDLSIDLDYLGTKPEILYLKVSRSYLWAITFLIGWDTNLTVLHGMGAVPGAVQEMLVCHTETDGGIDDLDETYITVVADGKTRVDDQWTMQFDDDYNYNLEPVLGTIRFVDSVKVTLREDDDGGYGEDDHFYYTIGTLPFWQGGPVVQTPTAVDEDDAGEYSISYNLSRTLQTLQQ